MKVEKKAQALQIPWKLLQCRGRGLQIGGGATTMAAHLFICMSLIRNNKVANCDMSKMILDRN